MTLPKKPKPFHKVVKRETGIFERHNSLLKYVLWIDKALNELGRELGRYEMVRVTTKLTKDKAKCMHEINKLSKLITIESIGSISTATYHRQMNYDPNVEGVTV